VAAGSGQIHLVLDCLVVLVVQLLDQALVVLEQQGKDILEEVVVDSIMVPVVVEQVLQGKIMPEVLEGVMVVLVLHQQLREVLKQEQVVVEGVQ